jgi:ATP-binding cassette subfamily F protein 3
MSLLLSVRDVTRQFDADPILQNVGFDLRSGEKVGLVGPNGCGKTTLLKILLGLDDADSGQVDRPARVSIDLLEQAAEFPPGRTLIKETKSALAELYGMQQDSTKLAAEIASTSDPQELEQLQRRFDRLQEDLHRLDGYNIDHRVDEILLGLGFQFEDYDRPIREFSGGQKSRVLLARLLLQSPDLMLLDEPTNHLDIAATEWLEEFLKRTERSMLVVSHDRYFLDRVTNRTLELHAARLTDYPGNFTAYWSLRAERNKVLDRTQEKRQEFVARTEDFIRRNKSGQKHAQASDREKKLERLEQLDQRIDFQSVAMTFGKATRTGDWVIDAKELAKGFPDENGDVVPLFSGFTHRIERGDRVGILGPNGSGKTTLLRTLIGELEADRGRVRHGTDVKIGYYDQQLESVDPQLDAINAIRPADDLEVTPGTLRELLASFGVRGDLALQRVGDMSGGERSKVALAKVAALKVNVLVLDEPTNHLDLWARDALEAALAKFAGTLLFVSHDRYFLDRVATNVIVLDPQEQEERGHWRFYAGNYSDFVQFRQSMVREAESARASERQTGSKSNGGRKGTSPTPSVSRRKFVYRKVEDLEVDIANCEAERERLEADLGDPAVHRDGERVKELKADYDANEARLEQLYKHWEEAMELN